jgi:Folylpolyglutamate synthase
MMKDKEHVQFMKSFEGLVNSVTLIDIPNQEGAITKEEFRGKICNLNLKINISNTIENSIKSLSLNKNNIFLVVGSLYLAGEVLNLN